MDGLMDTAKKYTEYDLIQKYTSLPEFPELRTGMLHAFLRFAKEKALPPKLQEALSIAVSLMQHALDSHELVRAGDEQRRRQLTVLAGDYFSSRFYQLLSQAGSVHAIGVIAQAVCEVNKMKMNVYAKAKRLLLTAEEYLLSKVDIHSHLYIAFAPWLDERDRQTFPAIFRTVVECEFIASELARTKPDNVKGGWAYWYVLHNGTPEEADLLGREVIDGGKLQTVMAKYNIVGKLSDMWETKAEELRSLLRMIGSDKLADELFRLAEPLFAQGKSATAQQI